MQFFIFFQRSLHDVRCGAEEFYSIRSVHCILLDPFPCAGSIFYRLIRSLSKKGIGKYPGGCDAVCFTQFFFMQYPIQATSASWFPDSGDAVSHPKFEHIFSRDIICCTADMTMHVNETRKSIHSIRFELIAAILELRTMG